MHDVQQKSKRPKLENHVEPELDDLTAEMSGPKEQGVPKGLGNLKQGSKGILRPQNKTRTKKIIKKGSSKAKAEAKLTKKSLKANCNDAVADAMAELLDNPVQRVRPKDPYRWVTDYRC